jgi:uroporphyrinogen decarboxylase
MGSKLNERERFLATMAFEPVDRVPLWEYDYWGETLRVWRAQGAPLQIGMTEGVNPQVEKQKKGVWNPFSSYLLPPLVIEPGVSAGFQMDSGLRRVPLNAFISPTFEYQVLKVKGDEIISRDERGHIRRDLRGQDGVSNIIKPLVADREDWERVKAERLQLSIVGRLPPDWPQLKEDFRSRDYPLAIGGHSALAGFHVPARYLMSTEGLLYGLHDQPELVKDIIDHLADLQLYLFDQVLGQIDVDLGFACEDLAYKTGPFISPAMFRHFILPSYKRLTGLLRDHGVNIMIIDSDGDNWDLIPLFMEGGVTGMGPMEVAAGMDVVRLRKAFPHLQIIGGIDKRKLAAGKPTIDEELGAKVPYVLPTGGYIPCCDHGVPPDVSWENFCYYRDKLEKLVTRGIPR